MKYAWKNLIRMLRNDKLIAFLACLCIAASVTVMHFSYGIYQHYHALLVAEKSSTSELQIQINNSSRVTVSALIACMKSLSAETQNAINICAANMKIDVDMKNPSEPLPDELMDTGDIWVPVFCFFNVQNGEIIPSEKFHQIQIKQNTFSGQYFTDAQFRSGEKVALFDNEFFKSKGKTDRESAEYRKRQIQFENPDAPEGYDIMLGGERYRVIGSVDTFSTVIVPLTALPDDTQLESVLFINFGSDTENGFITRAQFENIQSTFSEHFGDAVTIPELKLPDIDLQYLYQTVLLIAVLISAVAAFNFTQLYLYILEKRRKRVSVMRICGCTKQMAAKIFLAECLMLLLPVYGLAALLFSQVILPLTALQFPDIPDSFSVQIYAALFVIYLAVSLAELLIMIVHFLAGKELLSKERGL